MPVASETVGRIAGVGGRGRDDGGFGDDGGRGGRGRSRRVYRTGIWIALAPIVMMFVAFSSAYIVRRGLGDDWQPLELPSILWLNTVLLAASSLALERSRDCLNRGLPEGFNRWWSATTALGVAFPAGPAGSLVATGCSWRLSGQQSQQLVLLSADRRPRLALAGRRSGAAVRGLSGVACGPGPHPAHRGGCDRRLLAFPGRFVGLHLFAVSGLEVGKIV